MSEYKSGYGTSHALIVGINTYSDPRFMPLGNAESDAHSVAELLGAPPYNFQITQILGANATKSTILKALNQLRRTQADDRILVYFAGHGYTLSDRLGNETGFLACADTIPDEDFTALKLEDVIDLTRHSEAKHIGFVFDACFSGQALGLTRAPSVTADKLMQRRAYQVISAGAGDQTVSDYQSMTGRLVEALRTDILMSDGLVTMGELGLHLQQAITADSGQTQIPQFGHIRGSQGGDFVFYVDMSVRLPAELEDVLRSNRATVRMSGVVELIEIANNPADELATIAQERLAAMVQSDPDERVREAAQSYFDEQDAERIAEEAQRKAEAARRAREIGPASMRKPEAKPREEEIAPAESEPAPKPVAAAPAPAPTPVIAVSKRVEVNVPESKAAPSAASSLPLPMPAIYGIGGLLAVIVIGVIAMAILNGNKGGDNENDNNTPTQVVADSPTSGAGEPTDQPTQAVAPTEERPDETMQAVAPTEEPSEPSGPQIVFHKYSLGDGNTISLMNVDGTSARVFIRGSQVYQPDWSPDGTKVAYVSDGDIFVKDANGPTKTQLTFTDDITEGYPAWSPDGNRIAFDGGDSTDQFSIYVINADGTNLTQLTTDGSSGDPDWSPDGSKIVFESARAGNWDIYVMNSDGTNQQRMTTSSITYRAPAWSPLGDKIVFSGSVEGNFDDLELFIMNADGSALARLTTLDADCNSPAWSPDALKIVFEYGSYPDDPDLMVINSDGTGSVRLTLEGSERDPSWGP